MKLTEEQIAHIEDFINKSNIKYYEVYMEILDHMILSAEDILDKEDITFEEAILKAKKEGFGTNGFKKLVLEKQNLLNDKNRKSYFKQVKTFFTFPKIVFTLFVFVFYTSFLSYFESPRKANTLFILTLSIIALFQYYYLHHFNKKEGFKVLKINFFWHGINTVMLWMHFTNIISNLGKETIDFQNITTRIFCSFCFTMSLLSLLIFIDLRKKTIAELKKEIFI